MHIILNGDRHDLAPGTSVKSLLDLLGLDARIVAVELNRKVVKRDLYATTPVPAEAEVEIVSFVGGG
ncbi:MAG TPA: sulfur carrier protein ThiS [Vicinamibacterales bacterium]|nr:sulfur carrier protein ThiS [Vicinamibacterales bacterium]